MICKCRKTKFKVLIHFLTVAKTEIYGTQIKRIECILQRFFYNGCYTNTYL